MPTAPDALGRGLGALEQHGRAVGEVVALQVGGRVQEQQQGGLGVGRGIRVAGERLDVRGEVPEVLGEPRLLRRLEEEQSHGGIPAGVDHLRVPVGVVGVRGAGDGLHQPVHREGVAVQGDQAVGGQPPQRLGHRERRAHRPQVRYVEGLQIAARDPVRRPPGDREQHDQGHGGVVQPVQRHPPDASDGALRLTALRRGGVHVGRVPGKELAVGPRADPRLPAVRGGLVDRQGQAAEVVAQLLDPVGGALVDLREQLDGLGGFEDVEAQRLGDPSPPRRAPPGGDQETAGGGAVEERCDVRRVRDVVQDEQPAVVGGEPVQGALAQRLLRQGPGQGRLEGPAERGETRVEVGRGLGRDPPDRVELRRVPRRPVRRERGLADAAQPVDGVHDDAVRRAERLVQPGEFPLTPDEQRGTVRQMAHAPRVRSRGQGLRRQERGVLDDVVARGHLPDAPGGPHGPLPAGLGGRVAHVSPVDTQPMSPPAATERSPEAVTAPPTERGTAAGGEAG